MADTVTVTACCYHTLGGVPHPEGSTYQAPADQVENLLAQGFVERGGAAPAVTPAAKTPAPADAAPETPSPTAVQPLSTSNTKALRPTRGGTLKPKVGPLARPKAKVRR